VGVNGDARWHDVNGAILAANALTLATSVGARSAATFHSKLANHFDDYKRTSMELKAEKLMVSAQKSFAIQTRTTRAVEVNEVAR
jgi:hypothetical protein